MTEQTKVEHLFNSTINEGSLYTGRVQTAKTFGAGQYLSEQSVALAWINHVSSAIRVYQRDFEKAFDLNGRERLELASMLHDYYAEHINESA